MTGDGPNTVHFGPKMDKHSRLLYVPQWPKWHQNGQSRCSTWIISDKNEFFASNGQSRVLQRCFGAKNKFLFEMVQKGPA